MMKSEQKIMSTEQQARQSGSNTQDPPFVMEHLGKIKEMDRTFDIAFWQAQDATARMNAAWELVEFYHKLKGSPDELRLQRTVEHLQRKSS